MISGSSAFNALVIFVIVMFLFPLSWLRKQDDFLKAGGGSILLLVFALTSIRLLMPLETPFTYSVHSWRVLGVIQRFLRANPVIIWSVAIGWGLGAVPVACHEIRNFYRIYKFCHSLIGVDGPRVKRAARRRSICCRVVVVPGLPIPFTAGLFRHTIYVPELDVSDLWLELILIHENQHIRSRDSWIKLFYSMVKVAFCWVKPIQAFGEDLDALLEMRCDRKVLAGLKEEEKDEYVKMVLDMAKRTIPSKCASVSELGGSATENSSGIAEQRLKILVDSVTKPCRKTMAVVGCCVALVLFLASYLVVFQPAGAPSTDLFEPEQGVSYLDNYDAPGVKTGISDADTFIFKDIDGRYHLYVDYHFIKYLSNEEIVDEEYQGLRIFEEGE